MYRLTKNDCRLQAIVWASRVAVTGEPGHNQRRTRSMVGCTDVQIPEGLDFFPRSPGVSSRLCLWSLCRAAMYLQADCEGLALAADTQSSCTLQERAISCHDRAFCSLNDLPWHLSHQGRSAFGASRRSMNVIEPLPPSKDWYKSLVNQRVYNSAMPWTCS